MNKTIKDCRVTLTASELLGVRPTIRTRFDLTATECSQVPRTLQGTLFVRLSRLGFALRNRIADLRYQRKTFLDLS